ncbi:MAG: Holliday junction branch migration protein RuvA [Blautia sp.]|nr:Holliday junction branch migration protein RuvA [Blautia sp.]
MIRFVKGTAVDMTEGTVVIETASGLGLEVFMTGNALAQIHMGQELKVHTYFHVKEDGMQLYGFFAKDDLYMFRLLLGVSGVGPKGALGVLSGLSADELRFAVLSDDVKTISKAPGIGKKTAQKLILELKDKLDLQEVIENRMAGDAGSTSAQMPSDTGEQKDRAEAVEALVALGYSGTDAMKAVKKVPAEETVDVESILKAALKNL